VPDTGAAGRVLEMTLQIYRSLSSVLYNGGSEALAWGIVIVVCDAMSQSASLAEMASMQPIAGAQYHWTIYLAPKSQKKFITWMQGTNPRLPLSGNRHGLQPQ
jgi:hypothetical protein